MRLAIVATPPLALVAIVTAGLALRPRRDAAPPPVPHALITHCTKQNPLLPPPPTCEDSHELYIEGWVTGGASHLRLAGPFLSTDVTTDDHGQFKLVIPVEGNVCELLREPKAFDFTDGSMHVVYSVDFGR